MIQNLLINIRRKSFAASEILPYNTQSFYSHQQKSFAASETFLYAI